MAKWRGPSAPIATYEDNMKAFDALMASHWYSTNMGYLETRVVINGVYHRVAQHRLVLQKKLGRKLGPNEVVHHLNEVKTDNRPENLEVMSRAQHAMEHLALPSQQEAARNGSLLTDWGKQLTHACGNCGVVFSRSESKNRRAREAGSEAFCSHPCWRAKHSERCLLEHAGERLSTKQWAERLQLNHSTLRGWLWRGKTLAQIIAERSVSHTESSDYARNLARVRLMAEVA